MVKVVCRKIGNSLGFIIPNKYLFKAEIMAGDEVELVMENNKIVLQKIDELKIEEPGV